MTQDRSKVPQQADPAHEIPCTVESQQGLGVQATLIPYRPPATPVQFHILAVPQGDWVEYTPGVLVEVGEETDPAWYHVLSCKEEDLANRMLRPFPQVGNPGAPFQHFTTLEVARLFTDEVTRPRWFFDQSGLQLQAAVEDATRVFGVAPDIWITQPVLNLNGSHPSLQIGESGATFSLAGLQRVVGTTEGMGCLQIQLPEAYGHGRAWFEPGSGNWDYVELRYPEAAGRVPSWTGGDNRGSVALGEPKKREETKQ